MPRGTRKIFYSWAVDRVNPGAGQDTTAEVGGYKLDTTVAAGAYPDASKGAALSSSSQAFADCLSAIRNLQSKGIDARGRIYYKIFGVDATNPRRALTTGEDDEVIVARVDLPEYSVRRKVSLANTEEVDFNIGSQLPQDLTEPVGG